MQYIRLAFRNLLRQKGYNILNIVGLGTGIAAGLLIALHLREELSYEHWVPDYENVYRVHSNQWAKSSPTLAPMMKERLPDISVITRLASYGSHVVDTDDHNPGEVNGFYADSTVFDVFGFKIIDGDRKQALTAAKTAVITKRTALRYFGTADAVGKVLKFDTGNEFPVTAVIDDPPHNSHLQFDYLISMQAFYQDVSSEWINHRGWMVMYTYARFASPEAFQKTKDLMFGFLQDYYKGFGDNNTVQPDAIQFQPLADIHLKSHDEQEMSANGNVIYVYIFVAVELLILVVASANFMSLFTTQAIRRMKEVGMRKILGARPKHLLSQFLTEVILLTGLSLILAIILYQLGIPFYNSLTGKSLTIWDIFAWENLRIMAAIIAIVIVVSGLYPAYFISRFRTGSFLLENKLPNSMPSIVRNGLVVFQFLVSASLISSTIIVHQQMDLLQNKDLGFDKEQVVSVKLYGNLYNKANREAAIFKSEFLKSPSIAAVGRAGGMIGDDLSVESVTPDGREKDSNELPSVRVIRVDEDYLTVLGIPLVAGRNFSNTMNDSASFILNEAAVAALGIKDPIGHGITNNSDSRKGKIVGVVKDFHFASLRTAIEPLIIEWKPEWTRQLLVKMHAGKTAESMEHIRATIDKIAPGSLFVYNFLDDHLDELYRSENAMGKIFQFFSALAVIVACFGLLSLSAYTMESRTKEIGIRKVLGATVGGLLMLITSRFFKLVVAAFVLAVPLTWYAMDRWLHNFAYQIEITPYVFVATAVIILAMAAVAVGLNTVRAAMRNPVKSLRYE